MDILGCLHQRNLTGRIIEKKDKYDLLICYLNNILKVKSYYLINIGQELI